MAHRMEMKNGVPAAAKDREETSPRDERRTALERDRRDHHD